MADPQTPDLSPARNQGGNTDSVIVRTFIWDGENIVRQSDREYTHNPQQYGELISQGGDPGTYYHHYDALGSTMQMTDGDEAVCNEYLYRAFGEQSVLSGSHANPFTWVGRLGYYRQGDMGNYWLRARTYSQLAGRFLSRDPVPNGNPPGGWRTSRYIYPGNSPLVLVDPSGRQGYRGPRRRPEPVEAPTATVARRYGPGRFHRPHPPEPPEPPEPLEPQEPEEEEPLGGDGGVAPTGEGLACMMRTPGEKNKKAYGYGYRWVCQCPNQEHWECSMPTGWGPPKAGHTKKGNKFVKDLWASACTCHCETAGGQECEGRVEFRRTEWRRDTDEVVSIIRKGKQVKGKCVRGPECRLEWRMGAERSNAGTLTLSKKGRKPRRFRGWAGYSGPSYSGENVACGPESQCISCLGPVPAGEHEAGAWYTRASGGRAMRISDGFCAGRSAFLIHGGDEGSSRGCIVIPNIGELETQMGEKHFNCNYPVKLTVTYSIASAGDCPGSYFAKGTFSANCVKITFNLPHTCNVGCAPEVLGPASAHLAAQSPALAGAVSDGPECEGC